MGIGIIIHKFRRQGVPKFLTDRFELFISSFVFWNDFFLFQYGYVCEFIRNRIHWRIPSSAFFTGIYSYSNQKRFHIFSPSLSFLPPSLAKGRGSGGWVLN